MSYRYEDSNSHSQAESDYATLAGMSDKAVQAASRCSEK